MTGWAATNTVREALERISLAATDDGLNVYEELHLLPTALAKIALVETALAAALDDLREDGYPVDDPDLDGRDDPQFKDELVRQWGAKKVALAAALRAVRGGA